MGNGPPVPRPTVNVGLIDVHGGEFSDVEWAALEPQLDELIAAIRARAAEIVPQTPFADQPLNLRFVSALESPGLQLVVRKGLQCGSELQCPLPFSRETCAERLGDERARENFRELLAQATAVLELDGEVRRPDDAIQQTIQIVLNQSDLLLLICGAPNESRHIAPKHIIREANHAGIPIVRIQLGKAATIELLDRGHSRPWREGLTRELWRILHPAGQPSGERSAADSSARHYFHERQPRIDWGFFSLLGKDLVLWNSLLRKRHIRFTDVMSHTRQEWDQDFQHVSEFNGELRQQIEDGFLAHFAWTDKLAIRSGSIYRLICFLKHTFGLLAVVFLAVGFYSKSFNWQGFGLQVLFVVVASVLAWVENHRHWHQRFLDYRFLAERFRATRVLFPLGVTVSLRHALSLRIYDQAPWTDWLYRAIVRQTGLVRTRLDGETVDSVRRFLCQSVLKGQRDYHDRNRLGGERIAARMYRTILTLWAIGLVAIFLRAVETRVWGVSSTEGIYVVTKVFALVTPSMAVILSAIRSHGEHARLAQRSAAMVRQLDDILADLDDLPEADSRQLSDLAVPALELLVSEVADWRILIKARSLKATP